MSKSANNYVGISEPPLEMLNKLMLIDDSVTFRFIELLSSRPLEQITQEKADVAAGRTSIIALKEAFAVEIVTRFHDAAAAADALARRRKVSSGELPDDVEEHTIQSEGGSIALGKALALANLVKSSSEGVRQIQGGAVHLGGRKLEKDEANIRLEPGNTYLVRVGSKNRKFANLKVV
ncbi:MAG: hypothetical protein JNK04_20135 [Myxococcales bacterium]|nr:hypothetical protein [Myxococcales bacterium]